MQMKYPRNNNNILGHWVLSNECSLNYSIDVTTYVSRNIRKKNFFLFDCETFFYEEEKIKFHNFFSLLFMMMKNYDF